MGNSNETIRGLIFIVAYNHEKLIEKTLRRIPREILCDSNKEILVIDDGSSDRTFLKSLEIRAQLQKEFGSQLTVITVLRNPRNLGYGGNQKLGYRYAIDHNFTHVFLIHGDGQYAPELLPQFFDSYCNAGAAQIPDAVFGSRMTSWKSAFKGGMPIYKIVGNTILTFFQNKLLGTRFSEFHSGYRSYTTSLLKQIPFERNSDDFDFDTEIIIQILAVKGIIKEIPIPTFYGDEVCNVNGFRYAFDVMRASVHYRLQKSGFLFDRKFDVGANKSYESQELLNYQRQILKRIDPKVSVLEIGSFPGPLARALSENGRIVNGIYISNHFQAPKCFEKFWHIDFNRNLDDLVSPVNSGRYDCVILSDILERMVNPEKFLEVIRESLPQRTEPVRFFASAENVGFFIVRLMLLIGQFNYTPRGILDRTHNRLFTKRSLKHIFRQCGYRITAVHAVPFPVSTLFESWGAGSAILEKLCAWFSRLFPGLFAYQFLLEGEILPTVNQLLERSVAHSAISAERASEASI